MNIADVVLSLIIWVIQKAILPIIPSEISALPLDDFLKLMTGTMATNYVYSFATWGTFFNLELLFGTIFLILASTVIFFLVRLGLLVISFFKR